MRLQSDAYDKVKEFRRDVPQVSPAAVRIADYPREPMPPVETCVKPLEPLGPCERREKDVSFSCPHVEPRLPCCDPDKRVE